MGDMGMGYGSECHLLRYLGRHRQAFDEQVLRVTGGDQLVWLDFGFDRNRPWPDAEWKGLGFLPETYPARAAWRAAWPLRGNVPNWDAVGRLQRDSTEEWVLVEAKANVAELRSDCQAKREGGLGQITAALDAAKQALGVRADQNWLRGYYQYCNRLAVLNLLRIHGIPSRLLLIYFLGDQNPGAECPATVDGWSAALDTQARHVGLPPDHPLADRIHRLFLPTALT
jgi:hypothetical protein